MRRSRSTWTATVDSAVLGRTSAASTRASGYSTMPSLWKSTGAIIAFARVVESGSFARAAGRLDVSVSSVSRQVADLEAHLDARLLNRTTRRLSLTESGRAFYERSLQLLADLEEAEESASAGTARPRGTLRLTCGITFGVRYLAPAIAEFVTRHPEMRFDVELSDRAVDLVDEGFDAALRIGKIGSQQLVGRKVGVTRLICCA